MKRIFITLIGILTAGIVLAQNNVYGKKVVGLDSLVADTIRARTQGKVWIQGFGAGVAGSNTEIQFNDNGEFGASSNLTWNGTTLGVTGAAQVDNLNLNGSTISSTSILSLNPSSDIFIQPQAVDGGIYMTLFPSSTDEIRFQSNGGGTIEAAMAADGTWDFNANSLTDIGSLLPSVSETSTIGGSTASSWGTGYFNRLNFISSATSYGTITPMQYSGNYGGDTNTGDGSFTINEFSSGANIGTFIQHRIGDDTGTVPVLQFVASGDFGAGNTTISNRPLFSVYNYRTKEYQINADGSHDFQSNNLDAINSADIGNMTLSGDDISSTTGQVDFSDDNITNVNNLDADSLNVSGQSAFTDDVTFSGDVEFNSPSGTFTPVLEFGGGTTGITYSFQSGKYYRNGNIVHVQIYIVLSSKGTSTGTAKITGLPYAGEDVHGATTLENTANPTFLKDISPCYVSIGGGTTEIRFFDSGATTLLDDTDFTNTSGINLTFLYFTTAAY